MSTKTDFSKLTLMDAPDLAMLIEVEAHERYTQFAERLGSHTEGDAASVFEAMAVNEGKHGEEIAKRRVALFGETRPNVKLGDIFDVEAPEVGSMTWRMSPLKAFGVALLAERKARDFYDRALRHVTNPEVKALFEELRQEEVEHIRMCEEQIAKLPQSARSDVEDEGAVPNTEGRRSAAY